MTIKVGNMDSFDKVRAALHMMAREVALDTERGLGGLFGANGMEYVEDAIDRRNQRIDDCLARIREINDEAYTELERELAEVVDGAMNPHGFPMQLCKDEVLN